MPPSTLTQQHDDDNETQHLSAKQSVFYLFLGVAVSVALSIILPVENAAHIGHFSSTFLSSLIPTSRTSTEQQLLLEDTPVTTRGLQENVQYPKIQLIFTMGLMGDGKLHDALGKSIAKSPAVQRLKELGVAPTKVIELHQLLYQTVGASPTGSHQPGLWNAHCEVSKTKANARQLHQQVVDKLREIQEMVKAAYTSSNKFPFDQNDPYSHILPIPVNTILFPGDAATIEKQYGHATYPTEFTGQSCHRLDFPSLDLLYSTCQEAKVDCRHLFLYRPPLHEIRSAMIWWQAQHAKENPDTTKPFQKHLATIHLYNTMLHIMTDEMYQYAPRNIGCMDIAGGVAGDGGKHHWKDLWKDIWWLDDSPSHNNATAFADSIMVEDADIFPQKDITRDELAQVLPTTTDPYLESFLQLHTAAIHACTKTLQQVNDYLQSQRPEAQ